MANIVSIIAFVAICLNSVDGDHKWQRVTLAASCLSHQEPAPRNIFSGRVREIGQMNSGRAAHAATLLDDGRVLITGGFQTGGGSLSSAEVFVPSTGKLETLDGLSAARASHTATKLPDGRILVAGGYNGDYLQSTEIFDPRSARFTQGSNMSMPRSEHTATVLSDGRVLIVGGVGTGWTFLADAEIYDPATGIFTKVGSMSTPRESHTANLLRDGRVLITGGHKDRRAAMTIFAGAETFDPAKGVFEPVENMTVKRHKHAAVLLTDGRVLVAGGSDGRDSRGAYTSLEIFEPRSGEFKLVGQMRRARYKLNGAIALLPNGKVLIAGGSDGAEIFDPTTGATTETRGAFGSHRLFATATVLNDGRVLIVGGYDQSNQVGSGAWIFEESAE